MHGALKEVFTSKIWEQNENFLRYKKKEWFKFDTRTRKSYVELWDVIAVPNPNESPRASIRIKPEKIIEFFLARTHFCTMSSIQDKKNTVWKRNCKSLELRWDNGIKYKKKKIRRNIMKLEKNINLPEIK